MFNFIKLFDYRNFFYIKRGMVRGFRGFSFNRMRYLFYMNFYENLFIVRDIIMID